MSKTYYIRDFSIKYKDKYIFTIKNNLTGDTYNIKDLFLNTTASPGANKAYNFFNQLINCNYNWFENGHSPTRIMLDVDYQPRIIFDNLLLSRARVRLKKEVLTQGKHVLPPENILEILAKKQINNEFIVYSDIHIKPEHMQFNNYYDYLILKDIIVEAKNFIYFEEVYPKTKIGNFNTEFLEDFFDE